MNAVRLLAPLLLLVSAVAASHPRPSAEPATPAADQECAGAQIRRGSTCIPLRDATDAEVREYLVRRSIRAYSGNCPCPYNTDRAGRRCGGRSAYSRPRGAAPLCYPADVSDAPVRRARTGG